MEYRDSNGVWHFTRPEEDAHQHYVEYVRLVSLDMCSEAAAWMNEAKCAIDRGLYRLVARLKIDIEKGLGNKIDPELTKLAA